MLATYDWTGWLAMATGFLVVVTGIMAFATFKAARGAERAADAAEKELEHGQRLVETGQAQVEQSQKQADAAVDSLLAATKPLLVPANGLESFNPTPRRFRAISKIEVEVEPPRVAKHFYREVGHVRHAWLILAVRNIGNGPARFTTDPNDIVMLAQTNLRLYGWITTLMVAPGDLVYVTFSEPAPLDGGSSSLDSVLQIAKAADEAVVNRIEFTLRYTDVSGTRWMTSRFHFQLNAAGLDERAIEVVDSKDG